MTAKSNTGNSRRQGLRQFGLMMLILVVVLGFLFRNAFRPEMTVFSNDGPLGAISSKAGDVWASRDGAWLDLNWLGSAGISSTPTISNTLALVGGKLTFSKIYAVFSLLFVGFSAWFCFRQWKFTPLACILGGIAGALNGDFLPTTCWGVCAQPIAFALNYLALGALADTTSIRGWLRVILAGFAVGMGVMEAFDIGALFSLAVACYVVAQVFMGEGSVVQKASQSFSRLAVLACFAGFIAVATLTTLINTQLKGVGGMSQDTDTKARRWDEATMWSLPKSEAVDLVVPALFGFRMDTPNGGVYWGKGGRHAAWDRYFESGKQGAPPQGYPIRYGGGSGYIGALVFVIIVWGAVQSFRKNGVFTRYQRRMMWFWMVMVVITLLLAVGRFAPFYQFFYALPYASTIRNPAKFMHIMEWALVILFAYGVDGLSRTFMQSAALTPQGWASQWKAWWAKATVFDRRWIRGSMLGVAALAVVWVFYTGSRGKLIDYLGEVGYGDPGMAGQIASFSARQLGWGIFLITVSLVLVALVMSGCFSGKRVRLGGILLGVLLVLDLGTFSVPWVITYNWQQRLQSSPLIDLLKDKAYERRVTVFPLDNFINLDALPKEMAPIASQYRTLKSIYGFEWTQHVFPYYNIQALDVVQEPRMGSDKMAFESGMATAPALRRWQLTNTRYLLGPTAIFSFLNERMDVEKKSFRIVATFDFAPKPGITTATQPDELTTVLNPNGQFAVFEYGDALPRAKLYAHWQVATNDSVTLSNWVHSFQHRLPEEFYGAFSSLDLTNLATLKQLGDPKFNPAQTVLLAAEDAVPPSAEGTNQNAGTLQFVSYEPKRLVFQANAAGPAVLLVTDRYNPFWQVTVDGKPAPLLRCNFISRGVYLPAGEHKVEFYFSTPARANQISLAAILLGFILITYLVVVPKRETETGATATPAKPAKK